MTSPSELLSRFVLIGYFLAQKPPPMPSPSELFTQHLLDPIPESVANIKADRPSAMWGYTYTLRFNINRADLNVLIDSQPFQKVWSAKYDHDHGWLFWGWDRPGPLGMPKRLRMSKLSTYLPVYRPGRRRKPAWFRPELWDDPEAYALQRKEADTEIIKVLLYNDTEGEAYFIVDTAKI
jgi:hypothetical protein